MQVVMQKYVLIVIWLLVAGCSAFSGTHSDFNKLEIGMSKQEVIQAMGDPDTTEADASRSEERLYYTRVNHTAGWFPAPSMYIVTLQNDRVIKWGEKRRRHS
jgi:outer membrane protein assembly factor BamE (lipoprotein component of BamABCDE complex)